MTFRKIFPTELNEVSVANANTNYEGVYSRGSTASAGRTGWNRNDVDIYADVDSQCISDIATGIMNGAKDGPWGAVKSCTEGHNNNGGGGSVSPGQCTW